MMEGWLGFIIMIGGLSLVFILAWLGGEAVHYLFSKES
jgi:hypothetical protein